MNSPSLAAAQFGLPDILSTDEAAQALNRKPQTLRKWACLGTGAIQPVRISGRLAWKVSDIAALINNPQLVNTPKKGMV